MKLTLFIAAAVIAFMIYRIIKRKIEKKKQFFKLIHQQAQMIIDDHKQALGAALHKDIWTDWAGDMDTSSWDLEVDKFLVAYIDPMLNHYMPADHTVNKDRGLLRDDIKHMIDETARENMSGKGMLHSEDGEDIDTAALVPGQG